MASVPKQKAFSSFWLCANFPVLCQYFAPIYTWPECKKVLCSRTLATQGTKNVACMGISEIWTTSNLISVMVRFDNLKTKEIE